MDEVCRSLPEATLTKKGMKRMVIDNCNKVNMESEYMEKEGNNIEVEMEESMQQPWDRLKLQAKKVCDLD